MASAEPLKTPLHAWHAAHGGRMVEFGGWSMPVQYSTIVQEHRAVRERVGLFDISHMGRLLFSGPDALGWLNHLTTNDVARLTPGQTQYSLMVDDRGGVLDDILVFRPDREPYLGDGEHRPVFQVVCNASNRPKVVARFEAQRGGLDAALVDDTTGTAMIAVQGPLALDVVQKVADRPLTDMKYYHGTSYLNINGPGGHRAFYAQVSRTGYTGEDGFELTVWAAHAERLWEMLLEAGRAFDIAPCGLGARDTLRFEAAMPLYGHELSEEIDPYEAGLGWVVKLGKGDFLGRDALRRLKDNSGRTRVGIELAGKRIARQGSIVEQDGRAIGSVTSGTFAPTLQRSLAMALIEPAASTVGTPLSVDVRGRDEPAQVVKLPFYRRDPKLT